MQSPDQINWNNSFIPPIIDTDQLWTLMLKSKDLKESRSSQILLYFERYVENFG